MTVSSFSLGKTNKPYQVKLLTSGKYLTNYHMSVAS